MNGFKRVLALSAAALAVVAFITMLAPLSSHVYSVEEVKPHVSVTSWTNEWTSPSTSYVTETSTKTKYSFTDDPNDSIATSDIQLLVLEKEGELLHIYLFLGRGEVAFSQLIYRVGFDLDGDALGDYIVWLYSGRCELWRYSEYNEGGIVSRLRYEVDRDRIHLVVPIREIDGETSFYVWAEIDVLGREYGRYVLYYMDCIGISDVGYRYLPPNPVDLELAYPVTKTFYTHYTYTSTLSSTYTTNSTETHTLTEKVPLSYWHGWLPYVLFASAAIPAVVLLISSTLAPSLASRKKPGKAKLVIAVPEGGIVKLCPSCGMGNPLDAEYCMECGAKLS